MKKQIIKYITQYHVAVIWVVLLGLFGFTLWKIQAISNPKPDPEYLKEKRLDQPSTIEIKDSLRAQLEELENTPVNTQPSNVGIGDPFNP